MSGAETFRSRRIRVDGQRVFVQEFVDKDTGSVVCRRCFPEEGNLVEAEFRNPHSTEIIEICIPRGKQLVNVGIQLCASEFFGALYCQYDDRGNRLVGLVLPYRNSSSDYLKLKFDDEGGFKANLGDFRLGDSNERVPSGDSIELFNQGGVGVKYFEVSLGERNFGCIEVLEDGCCSGVAFPKDLRLENVRTDAFRVLTYRTGKAWALLSGLQGLFKTYSVKPRTDSRPNGNFFGHYQVGKVHGRWL